MNRPTKEQVEHALELAEWDTAHAAHRNAARLLAAEVRALRSSEAAANEEAAELERKLDEWVTANIELRATVARVEALPKSWRDEEDQHHGCDAFNGYNCADFLEQALRGAS